MGPPQAGPIIVDGVVTSAGLIALLSLYSFGRAFLLQLQKA